MIFDLSFWEIIIIIISGLFIGLEFLNIYPEIFIFESGLIFK